MNKSTKSNPATNILDANPHLRQTLELVADKWVVAVLYILSGGTKRYGELQREIGEISQRMLTRTLPVVPPMVEYSLTPLGETMNGVLKSVCDWSTQNFDAVEAARIEYDSPSVTLRDRV
jgi:DNA-binding HxlR family transcriptional regulator